MLAMPEAPRKPLSLEEIEHIVLKLATCINAPDGLLPTFDGPDGFARPHMEVHGGLYYWVVSERGVERQRRTTTDMDLLLYWVFEDVTFSMASEYECHHRSSDVDSRRLLFKRHLELLEVLSPSWRDKRARELEVILWKHPFNDGLPNRL